jgi:hypothetical protein
MSKGNSTRANNDSVAGLDYPTLEELRRLGYVPRNLGFPVVPTALEEYMAKYGISDPSQIDPGTLAYLINKHREE